MRSTLVRHVFADGLDNCLFWFWSTKVFRCWTSSRQVPCLSGHNSMARYQKGKRTPNAAHSPKGGQSIVPLDYHAQRTAMASPHWTVLFAATEIEAMIEAEREHRSGPDYIEAQLLRETIAESVAESSAASSAGRQNLHLPVVQDAAPPSAVSAIPAGPAVPAAEVLELDVQLSAVSAVPAVSAVEVLQQNYEETLGTVLAEYATNVQSLHEAVQRLKDCVPSCRFPRQRPRDCMPSCRLPGQSPRTPRPLRTRFGWSSPRPPGDSVQKWPSSSARQRSCSLKWPSSRRMRRVPSSCSWNSWWLPRLALPSWSSSWQK
jgi:hypothetical protein